MSWFKELINKLKRKKKSINKEPSAELKEAWNRANIEFDREIYIPNRNKRLEGKSELSRGIVE